MDQKSNSANTSSNSTSQQLEHISDTLNLIKKFIENLPDHNKNTEVVLEIRINEELKRLREEYQTGLNIINHTQEIRWKIIAICSGVFSLFAIFVAPQQILKPIVTKYIDEKLIEPKLQEAADRITGEKMGTFVDTKLEPLESKIGSLTAYIDNIKHDISKKQKRINNKQVLFSKLLKIQELTASCKAGTPDSYAKYNELRRLAGEKTSFQPFANAALRDIFFYFDTDSNVAGRGLIKSTLYSVDEVINIYHTEDPIRDMQESAINTLAILKRDTAVQEICDSIYKEQNLRVISRMIRALKILTGEPFDTLDINAVKTWWENYADKEKYKSYYKEYMEAVTYLEGKKTISEEESKYLISLLDKTIKMDPDALHARCLRASILTYLRKESDAEKEFNEVENRNNKYRWLFYYRAILFLNKKEKPKAIESLKEAISIFPSMDEIIIKEPIFNDILNDLQLKKTIN